MLVGSWSSKYCRRLTLHHNGFDVFAQLCTVEASVGALDADAHTRKLVALDGAGLAGRDARSGFGAVTLGEVGCVLFAHRAAIVTELNAKIHATLGLALFRAFVAKVSARSTSGDTVSHFFGQCHFGVFLDHAVRADPTKMM